MLCVCHFPSEYASIHLQEFLFQLEQKEIHFLLQCNKNTLYIQK
uniref:Uncharacterized protein n=1 Tax=Anguilla anguilla TaxID=7936 RepID=A0A0E9WY99_ANGAN